MVRGKIIESQCDIICLQETKREHFDAPYVKKFCPAAFDSFVFLPSVGASGGSIIIWKGNLFSGSLIFQNDHAISVEFQSLHTGSYWILINIYGPCTHEGKLSFLNWFENISMPDDVDWLVLGDFNLIRGPSNRNKPSGDVNEMFLFNAAISKLGLVELPLKGQAYTWSNKQGSPLLERLDWFFTSTSWIISYPGSEVWTLSRDASDHVPCLVQIKTNIPKAQIFRFENYWMEHRDFLQILQHGWSVPSHQTDKAKFKNLRNVLRSWQAQLSSLATLIENTRLLICLIDFFRGS